jgi:hypothetical protein
MDTSSVVLPLMKELVYIKRTDIRKSQLDVLTVLINGAGDKNILLNQIVAELIALTNVGPKYVRHNCIELLIAVIHGLGPDLEQVE